jgi:hypothetical protein
MAAQNQANAVPRRSIVQAMDVREPLDRKRWQPFDDVAELLAGYGAEQETPGRPADDLVDPWERAALR